MHFDAIVIGTGQAGVPLAVRLAGRGRSVLVCERAELGGTCINYGCTPTKTMVASAAAAHAARRAASLGVRVGDVRVDMPAVVARKDAMVRDWRAGVERRLGAAGDALRLVRAHARFVGEREIEAGGERHTGDVVIINTGARPAVPPVHGLDAVPWLDNVRVMELREVPRHLLVVGGGYIGCELGQAFRRFGAAVSIVDPSPHLLGREDDDVAAALEAAFREEDIALYPDQRVTAVEGRAGQLTLRLSGGASLEGSHVLVATGRRPNTDDLGCDAAGIELGARGHVVVDAHYRTSADGVYAVGDVTGGPQFTHASWDDHRILMALLDGHGERTRDDRIVPHVVFTDPQVAGVGLTEREATRRGLDFDRATLPFGNISRAIETGRTAGLVKVLLERDGGRILGASIVGAEAGELIHVFVALMAVDGDARALVDAEMVHPAFAEGLQSVLMTLERYAT